MTPGVIRRGQLYALASMMIWSTNYILGRLLREAVTPATISLVRALVASALLGGWLVATRGRLRMSRQPDLAERDLSFAQRGPGFAGGVPPLAEQGPVLMQQGPVLMQQGPVLTQQGPVLMQRGPVLTQRGVLQSFLILGCLGIFASQYLTYLALHWSLASNATILNAASPIVTATLGVAAGLTPYSRGLFGGLAVSGTGAALLTVLGASSGERISVDPGALLIIATMVTWGIYNLCVQRLSRTLPPTIITMGAMLAGIPFLLAALAVEHPPHLLASVRVHLPALLYLAIGPSAAAYVCWNAAVRDVGASHAMAFNNMLPLFGMILGSAILHERVSAVQILASALVIGGIVITVRSQTGVLVMDLPETPPQRGGSSEGKTP